MTSDTEALVSVTQAYIRACYGDEAEHTLLDIIRIVNHCAQLFNQSERLEEVKHNAVEELARRLIPNRPEQ